MARSAGVVGLFTLLSRVLGLVRDGVVAALFSKHRTDAFFVAFKIPNVFRRLMAEGSLAVAFIPVYTDYLKNRGEADATVMMRATLGATLLALMAITGLGILFSPQLVWLFGEGLGQGDRLSLAVMLTRLMFPFLLTVGLVALAMGVLNTHKHFAAPAFAPVLLNVGIIGWAMGGAGLVAGWGLPKVTTLAFGVLTGGVLQLLLQAGPLHSRGLLHLPSLNLLHPGVGRIAKLMAPSLFGLAVYQLNIMLSVRFASFLEPGAVSHIYYAQRLIEFPLGIFAAGMATVAMPDLSAQAAAGKLDELKSTYRFALGIVAFILIPATAGLIALAEPVVAVLFQRGAFDHAMTRQTAITLMGFAVGLVAGGGVRQTAPVFFALQDTRTPVVASTVALLVYGGCAWSTYQRWGTLALALSVAVSSTVNFGLLVFLLRRRLGRLGFRALITSVVRASVAAGTAGAAAWGVARFGQWEAGGALPVNYLVLTLAVLSGVGVYLIVAALLKTPELDQLKGALKRRRGGG